MTLKKIVALLTLCATAVSANAADFSFTGTFEHDNDVQLFNFVVGSGSTISLRSWSYAGGTNAAGQTIVRGGFDPILALFDATGKKISEQDDADCPNVAADAVTGACWDTFFTTTLGAGTYTASVQQYNNFASASLATGFAFDGAANQNFRNGFIDANNNKRTASWAFDILNVTAADLPADTDVPEPAPFALLGLAVVGMAAARRRKAA